MRFRYFMNVLKLWWYRGAPYRWEDLFMKIEKLRYAIIAALVSFFAMSLAFAGEEKAETTAEEDAAAIEAPAEDAATAEAAKEETVAAEEEEAEDEVEDAE